MAAYILGNKCTNGQYYGTCMAIYYLTYAVIVVLTQVTCYMGTYYGICGLDAVLGIRSAASFFASLLLLRLFFFLSLSEMLPPAWPRPRPQGHNPQGEVRRRCRHPHSYSRMFLHALRDPSLGRKMCSHHSRTQT